VWGATIVSAPAGVASEVTPTATQYYTNNYYSFTNRAFPVTLQIMDASTGTNLTTQTNTVIVGQQMNLTCQLSITNSYMTNFVLTNFLWTVPGTTFSNFVANGSSGILYTNFPTTQSNAVFCWSDSGLKQVQISATINGKTVTGQAWFNIVRPTANITTQTTSVGVDTFLTPPRLGFYDVNTYNPGITFTSTMTIPAGFTGSNEWVQIVLNPYRVRQDTNLVWWLFTENGAAPYLDTHYPYNSLVATNIAVDSPFTPLLNGYVQVTATNSFEMWLMFKPTGGQWVPLRTVNWNWSGTASLSGTNWVLNGNGWSANPTDADAGTTFPQWNSNVTNATYQAQP
jgi:hypothetical protein